jgi:hypothetical protein
MESLTIAIARISCGLLVAGAALMIQKKAARTAAENAAALFMRYETTMSIGTGRLWILCTLRAHTPHTHATTRARTKETVLVRTRTHTHQMCEQSLRGKANPHGLCIVCELKLRIKYRDHASYLR